MDLGEGERSGMQDQPFAKCQRSCSWIFAKGSFANGRLCIPSRFRSIPNVGIFLTGPLMGSSSESLDQESALAVYETP